MPSEKMGAADEEFTSEIIAALERPHAAATGPKAKRKRADLEPPSTPVERVNSMWLSEEWGRTYEDIVMFHNFFTFPVPDMDAMYYRFRARGYVQIVNLFRSTVLAERALFFAQEDAALQELQPFLYAATPAEKQFVADVAVRARAWAVKRYNFPDHMFVYLILDPALQFGRAALADYGEPDIALLATRLFMDKMLPIIVARNMVLALNMISDVLGTDKWLLNLSDDEKARLTGTIQIRTPLPPYGVPPEAAAPEVFYRNPLVQVTAIVPRAGGPAPPPEEKSEFLARIMDEILNDNSGTPLGSRKAEEVMDALNKRMVPLGDTASANPEVLKLKAMEATTTQLKALMRADLMRGSGTASVYKDIEARGDAMQNELRRRALKAETTRLTTTILHALVTFIDIRKQGQRIWKWAQSKYHSFYPQKKQSTPASTSLVFLKEEKRPDVVLPSIFEPAPYKVIDFKESTLVNQPPRATLEASSAQDASSVSFNYKRQGSQITQKVPSGTTEIHLGVASMNSDSRIKEMKIADTIVLESGSTRFMKIKVTSKIEEGITTGGYGEDKPIVPIRTLTQKVQSLVDQGKGLRIGYVNLVNKEGSVLHDKVHALSSETQSFKISHCLTEFMGQKKGREVFENNRFGELMNLEKICSGDNYSKTVMVNPVEKAQSTYILSVRSMEVISGRAEGAIRVPSNERAMDVGGPASLGLFMDRRVQLDIRITPSTAFREMVDFNPQREQISKIDKQMESVSLFPAYREGEVLAHQMLKIDKQMESVSLFPAHREGEVLAHQMLKIVRIGWGYLGMVLEAALPVLAVVGVQHYGMPRLLPYASDYFLKMLPGLAASVAAVHFIDSPLLTTIAYPLTGLFKSALFMLGAANLGNKVHAFMAETFNILVFKNVLNKHLNLFASKEQKSIVSMFDEMEFTWSSINTFFVVASSLWLVFNTSARIQKSPREYIKFLLPVSLTGAASLLKHLMPDFSIGFFRDMLQSLVNKASELVEKESQTNFEMINVIFDDVKREIGNLNPYKVAEITKSLTRVAPFMFIVAEFVFRISSITSTLKRRDEKNKKLVERQMMTATAQAATSMLLVWQARKMLLDTSPAALPPVVNEIIADATAFVLYGIVPLTHSVVSSLLRWVHNTQWMQKNTLLFLLQGSDWWIIRRLQSIFSSEEVVFAGQYLKSVGRGEVSLGDRSKRSERIGVLLNAIIGLQTAIISMDSQNEKKEIDKKENEISEKKREVVRIIEKIAAEIAAPAHLRKDIADLLVILALGLLAVQ